MVAMAFRYCSALVLIVAGITFLPPTAATIGTLGGMVALGYTLLVWFVAYHVVMYRSESPEAQDDPTTV